MGNRKNKKKHKSYRKTKNKVEVLNLYESPSYEIQSENEDEENKIDSKEIVLEEPEYTQEEQIEKPEASEYTQEEQTEESEAPEYTQEEEQTEESEAPEYTQEEQTEESEAPEYTQEEEPTEESEDSEYTQEEPTEVSEASEYTQEEEQIEEPEVPEYTQEEQSEEPEVPEYPQEEEQIEEPEVPEYTQEEQTEEPEVPEYPQEEQIEESEAPEYTQEEQSEKPEVPEYPQEEQIEEPEAPEYTQEEQTEEPETPEYTQEEEHKINISKSSLLKIIVIVFFALLIVIMSVKFISSSSSSNTSDNNDGPIKYKLVNYNSNEYEYKLLKTTSVLDSITLNDKDTNKDIQYEFKVSNGKVIVSDGKKEYTIKGIKKAERLIVATMGNVLEYSCVFVINTSGKVYSISLFDDKYNLIKDYKNFEKTISSYKFNSKITDMSFGVYKSKDETEEVNIMFLTDTNGKQYVLTK